MISKTYCDILNEIQIYNTRILYLKREKKQLLYKCRAPMDLKGCCGEITGIRATKAFMSVEDIYLRIGQIDDLIEEYEEMLGLLCEQLNEINRLLYKLEGRNYKIFHMHRCENKSFKEIAKEVGLSLSQVQRIYKEVINE